MGQVLMFTAIGFVASIAMAGVMTMIMIGAIYEHRRALPIVGAVFVAIIVFGIAW